ncbi:MAG: hypothetical protein MI866_20320 [Bacteroidales bacterium]|nr:hypothetical protein [Bacteroidales bacterium]
MKNFAELGVQELDAVEMKKTDGGRLSWRDIVLIGKLYQKACQACDNFMMNNPDYTGGRSFNR